jgi:hypothetical protein
VPLGSHPGLYSRLLQQAASAEKRSGIAPNAIADIRSTHAFLIPAAASAQGALNTYFRSDITLVSYEDSPQDVMVFWAGNGAQAEPQEFLIRNVQPHTFYTFEDFVWTRLGQRGVGALYFIPVDGFGDFDAQSSLDGTSRIWTPQPQASGTMSQAFDAIDVESLLLHEHAVIMGLRQDPAYRTNFGICNGDDDPHTFHVRFRGVRQQTSLTVTVWGPGMIQQPVPAGDYGNLVIEIETADSMRPEMWWTAYASSVDNITGDGWVSVASTNLEPAELPASGR